jgi:Mg-chelatase subunit ChlD
MYDLVYNNRSSEIVNIPDLTGDGIFDINDLQPFWDRISTASDPNKWIWIYNHDMNRDGIVNIDDYITEKLDYYANPPLPSEKYQSYMDKNGNGCIDNSDVAWFQAAYDLYGDLDWDHAFKRTLTLNANGKFNWSLNLHDTNLNLNGCALYVGDSMSFTTDIPSFWSNGKGAELNICGGRLETGNNLVFRTASPDGWDGTTGQNMYLNGGSVVISGDFNFGQANCYDTIWMTNKNDYLEINHNWNYITLTDMEGKWTAGMINFQGPTWEVNEASGEKSVYSSGTHSIRFYYPDGKQTILWDNPNEYINAEDGTPNTLRTFNFNYIDPITGECLGLIFPNGYSEELYWFRPWFEMEDAGEWIPYDEWDNYPDTDGDGLPDKVELYIGTDPTKKDTDGDGLTDYDELFETFTDPTLYDTDSNGINDGQEDFDNDNLNNIEEIENGTDCYEEDTDVDGLTDGDEVKIYHSDPLKADTDGDTLIDGDDVALGFDPTLPDTDFNGILDCDEKTKQTLTLYVDDDTNPIESVTVSFKGTGNINKNTSITDIKGKDVLCSNVVGLVGNPYDINSTSQFNEAELSFKIRKKYLGATVFDDLAILWYNKDEQTFELIDCTLDSANSVVKATLPHFSKYMIVNRKEWAEAWATSLDYSKYDSYDIVYAIDCSGSMEDLDPEPSESGTASKRHMAANNLIGVMEEDDEAAVIGFNYTTSLLCDFTSDQSDLRSVLYNLYQEGSTNFNPVLSESISKLTTRTETSEETVGKMIILISDGGMLDDLDEPLNEDLLAEAKREGIKIYTIGVGVNVDEEILHKIAKATGGEYYYASTNDEISDLSVELKISKMKDIDMTDLDKDGLPDIFESIGMRLQDGTIIYTDPNKADSDTDGLLDGEEIDFHYDKSTGSIIFTMISNPNLKDSDGDGVIDNEDELKLRYGISELFDKSKDYWTVLRALKAEAEEDLNAIQDAITLYDAEDALNIIMEYDAYITSLSNEYMLPKAYIQSILFRELIFVNQTDKWADTVVEMYFYLKENTMKNPNNSVYEKIMIDYAMRDDSSTGYGQIFSVTAINAINLASKNNLKWDYSSGLNWGDNNIYNKNSWQDKKIVWFNLRDDNIYNVSVVPLVLMWGITTDECLISGMSNKYWKYTEEESKAIITRYNGNATEENPEYEKVLEYGEEVFDYFRIFSEVN